MAVRIRLQRHGKKGKPFYWIVAADSRSKRDGKYLEKIGTYDPNVNPPIVNLDIDATVKWIQFGAQPSDTARNIISREGALLKPPTADSRIDQMDQPEVIDLLPRLAYIEGPKAAAHPNLGAALKRVPR